MTPPEAIHSANRGEILARLRQIVAEREDIPIEDVHPDADLERDLGMDSLARVELIMAVEEVFDIEVQDHQADRIRTVVDAAEEIVALLESRPRSHGPRDSH